MVQFEKKRWPSDLEFGMLRIRFIKTRIAIKVCNKIEYEKRC
jgi:hypothetical protein